jgi:hypothetical protein
MLLWPICTSGCKIILFASLLVDKTKAVSSSFWFASGIREGGFDRLCTVQHEQFLLDELIYLKNIFQDIEADNIVHKF